MKTKTQKPIHLHVEHFFRHQYVVVVILAVMIMMVIKSTDSRVMSLIREAYAQGFGMIGAYMREETTRLPVSYDIASRLPTISGK